jgi:DNA-binding Lrp family transcriptional regulator
MEIKLNKNELSTLKLLIENASQTNVEISGKLGITPQAVGKIKRKLESSGVIRGYSAHVDLDAVGIKTFAIALFSYSPELSVREREEDLKENIGKANIMAFCRIPEGDVTHIVMYGFRDLNELENYFQRRQEERGFKSSLKRLYIFSSNGLLKNSVSDLVLNALSSGAPAGS